jgi:hypothetical protein
VIILEKHPVSGYEPRHYRREPDDVLTRRVDVDIDIQLPHYSVSHSMKEPSCCP